MKIKLKTLLVAGLLLAGAQFPLQAQLVADGATNTLYGADPDVDFGTNIVGSLIVGTNGSFTSLILNYYFSLTNSGDSYIGYNFGANSNRFTVERSGWYNTDYKITVGLYGSYNTLLIAIGGEVIDRAGGCIGSYSGANSNRVTVDNAAWNNVYDNLTVGRYGSCNTLLITNWGQVFNPAGYIGSYIGSDSNQVTVIGIWSLWQNGADVKVGDLGSFNSLHISNGGRVADTDAYIGYGSGSDSSLANHNQVTVTGANSTWANTGELHVGEYGGGNSLLIANGGQVANSLGYIGRSSDNNHVSVTGSGSWWTNSGLLTLGGTGNTLIITNGGTVASSGGSVDGFNNQVTVSDFNSAWTNSGPLTLGGGASTLLITNGGTMANSDGTFDSDNNQVTVSGLNSVWRNSGTLAVGNYHSFNTLLINSGGRLSVNFQSIIGNGGNNNQVTVADGDSVWTNGGDLTVGYYGADNTLLITNGSRVLVNSQSSIGNPGDNNHVIVTGFGSVWSNGVAVLLGNSGTDNTLLITDNGAVQSPQVTIGNSINLTSGSLLTVSNGTLTATGGGGTGGLDMPYGELVFNGGTITADRLLLTNGANSQFIFNRGTFNVGRATVANSSPLTVGDGTNMATYRMSGEPNNLHSFANSLLVLTNAALVGNGTVTGTVKNFGLLSPGASIGKITFNDSPVWLGQVVMEISKNGSTLTNDQIQVAGSLTYGGSLTVSNLGPDPLAAGDSFPLFNATGYSGVFSAISLPLLAPELTWSNGLTVDGTISVVARIPITVTSAADSGSGSLRDTITAAAPGDIIAFTNTLSGATILLTNGQLALNQNLIIDASALPAGIQINGDATNRVFAVASGTTVVLDSLTITNGNSNSGGGILNKGNLTANRCTLAGNTAAARGGGIENAGTLTVNQCTLTGNSCAGNGGAGIDNASGTVTLNQSTLTGNNASYSSGSGGIWGEATLNNSIVAGNAALTYHNIYGTITATGVNLTNGVPLLASLGNYGGPTPTMPPLTGSPAIDGCTNGTTFTTDQRGLPRIAGAYADIGAVELQHFVVVNADDSGPGSLRDTLTANPDLITFTNTLSGATILLTSSQLTVNRSLTIDASALPAGIQINGNANRRVFVVASGTTVVLDSLTITNGYAIGNYGGGIYNFGNLTVNRCTLAGNTATIGGGIENFRAVTLNQCTLTGNSCVGHGGAAMGNYAGLATITVNQSTLTGNNASASSGCGGIFNVSGSCTLYNSIVAGNTATNYPDIDGPITTTGVNLTNGAPLLASLGNYGGPTPTMPAMSGSPALDGCTSGATFTTDQRGAPRIAGPYADIGAVEGVLDPTFSLAGVIKLGDGSVLFGFTNLSGPSYSVLATTNVAAPLNTWSNLGAAVEKSPGMFQFNDPEATNYPERFYRVTSP